MKNERRNRRYLPLPPVASPDLRCLEKFRTAVEPESLKFSRYAGLDPASRSHTKLIIFWIPAEVYPVFATGQSLHL